MRIKFSYANFMTQTSKHPSPRARDTRHNFAEMYTCCSREYNVGLTYM